jgi:predicted secreted Zn-dependent protease
MKTVVLNRHFAFRPLVAISGFLSIILCAALCFGGSYVAGSGANEVAAADSLNASRSLQNNAGGQSASNTATVTKHAAGGTTTVNGPTETCVPFNGSLNPGTVALSDGSAGLIQQIDQPSFYQIFGNTSDSLRSQVRECGPKSSGQSTAQFAAETNYNLTWRYQYVGDGDGLCHVTNASVGIHINQVMPFWHPASGASSKFAAEWNTFSRNLTTHENGHISLDLQYAQTLLNDLQNFPSTSCDQLNESVRHLADSDSNLLAQANDNYDSSTNHGATQGAILP